MPGRGGNRDPGAGKEDITAGTRTHTREGHTRTEGPAPPPPPADAAEPPGTHAPNTRRRGASQTPYGSHRHTPTSHGKPHRGWRAHLHRENGLHPQRKPLATPPRSPPPRPHCQATTPATTRATSQAPEEDEGTATAPRARDRDPQRIRAHGTGPREGNPTDTYPTHQPEQHTQTPTARTERASHT